MLVPPPRDRQKQLTRACWHGHASLPTCRTQQGRKQREQSICHWKEDHGMTWSSPGLYTLQGGLQMLLWDPSCIHTLFARRKHSYSSVVHSEEPNRIPKISPPARVFFWGGGHTASSSKEYQPFAWHGGGRYKGSNEWKHNCMFTEGIPTAIRERHPCIKWGHGFGSHLRGSVAKTVTALKGISA